MKYLKYYLIIGLLPLMIMSCGGSDNDNELEPQQPQGQTDPADDNSGDNQGVEDAHDIYSNKPAYSNSKY